MPLDSDIADADHHLHVEFYVYDRRDPIDPATGEKKTNYEGKTFVRIMNPGDKTSVFDQPATEAHKRRFPRHWLAFQAMQQGDARMIGTPLDVWSDANPEDLGVDQMLELRAVGFQTVEQVAMASDHQTQKIGMGGAAIRQKAQAWLDRRNRSATEIELEATRKQLAEMQAMIAKLVENGSIQADPPRRGRPPKDRELTHVHDDDAATRSAGDERVRSSDA